MVNVLFSIIQVCFIVMERGVFLRLLIEFQEFCDVASSGFVRFSNQYNYE